MAPQSFENLKCIWMSSGVVDYRLCHLDFDCDHCEFDMAIRNKPNNTANQTDSQKTIFEEIKAKLTIEEYPANTTFLRNGYILRRVYQNSYLINFPILIWHLFEPVSTLNFSMTRGYLRKDEPLFCLSGDWGAFEAPAPFDLSAQSSFIEGKSSLQFGSWLGLIETDSDSIKAAEITAAQSRQHSIMTIDTIANEVINQELQTLRDGGKPVAYIHQALGSAQFLKLLKSLFS